MIIRFPAGTRRNFLSQTFHPCSGTDPAIYSRKKLQNLYTVSNESCKIPQCPSLNPQKYTNTGYISPYLNPNHFGHYCSAFSHFALGGTSHLAPSPLTPQHPYLAHCLPDSAIQCSPIWDVFTKCQRAAFTYATGEKDALQYIE